MDTLIERKNIIRLTIIIVSLLFAIPFGQKIERVVSNSDNCMCAYDGLGYYSYLPQLFIEGTFDLNHKEFSKKVKEYCPDEPIYQFKKQENGKWVDVYHMGMAVVETPGFLVGHLCAKIFGFDQDGYSKPYHISFLVFAFLYILFGVIVASRVFLKLFSPTISSGLLILTYFGTNAFITFTQQYDLPHLYLFLLNGIIIYQLLVYREKYRARAIIVAALAFGLATSIRPTEAIFGLIPLAVLFYEHRFNKRFILLISMFPVSAVLWNIPQGLYWIVIGGHFPLLNLHEERLLFFEPHLFEFLFSWKKGWLLYSPLFLVSILSSVYLFRKDKKWIPVILTFTIISVWVMASWECWWYAASFGQRPMTDFYILLLLPIGFMWQAIEGKRLFQIGLGSSIGLCFMLSVFQSYQFEKGYLHFERMSQEHYGYIFGQTNIENYSDHRLEIDRQDLNWPDKMDRIKDDDFILDTVVIFQSSETISSNQMEYIFLANSTVLNKTETNEVQLQFEWTILTDEATKNVELKVECMHRDYTLSWQSISLNQDAENDKKSNLRQRLNLPFIDDDAETLKLVVYNAEGAKLEISNLKLNAICLRRL